MWIDSHCHLQLLQQFDVHQAIVGAKTQGLSRMLTVSTALEHETLLKIREQAPDFIDVSVGLHPNQAWAPEEEPSESFLLEAASQPGVVAIGETGLDDFRSGVSGPSKMLQLERLHTHIKVAVALNKALIIHTRAAAADTLFYLKTYGADQTGGVIHCFTETLDFARAALDLGFYISFSGIITFKNAQSLRDVLAYIPSDRLLIETDAPYLAPVPFRGQENLPQYVIQVGACVAQVLDWPVERVAEITHQNYWACFLRNQ